MCLFIWRSLSSAIVSFDLTTTLTWLSRRVLILNSCTYSVHTTSSKGSQDASERKIIRYILVFGKCVDSWHHRQESQKTILQLSWGFLSICAVERKILFWVCTFEEGTLQSKNTWGTKFLRLRFLSFKDLKPLQNCWNVRPPGSPMFSTVQCTV